MSTCTKVTRSLYGFATFSSSSSTGPQYMLEHSAGVANSTATGLPFPTTSDSDTVCSGHGGVCVQIGFTPSELVVVGDAALGAASPGTGASAVAFTCCGKVFATSPPIRACTFQTPACANTVSARYTPRLRGRPSVSSRSFVYGPHAPSGGRKRTSTLGPLTYAMRFEVGR